MFSSTLTPTSESESSHEFDEQIAQISDYVRKYDITSQEFGNLVSSDIQFSIPVAKEIAESEPRFIYHSMRPVHLWTYLKRENNPHDFDVQQINTQWDKPILGIEDILSYLKQAENIFTDETDRFDRKSSIESIINEGIRALKKNQFLLDIAYRHLNGEEIHIYRYGKKESSDNNSLSKYGGMPYKAGNHGEIFGPYIGSYVTWWFVKSNEMNWKNNPYRENVAFTKGRKKFELKISKALKEGFITADYIDDNAVVFLEVDTTDMADDFAIDVN